jgi:hypothetical protein
MKKRTREPERGSDNPQEHRIALRQRKKAAHTDAAQPTKKRKSTFT